MFVTECKQTCSPKINFSVNDYTKKEAYDELAQVCLLPDFSRNGI